MSRSYVTGTGGTHETQERFGQAIVKLKRKQNKVRNFFARDYMGDPKAGAVEIPVRSLDVSVRDYNIETGVAMQQSATSYKRVLVDQEKAINELLDGWEAATVPDNLIAQRLESGSYGMGRAQELHAIGVLEDGGTQSPELAALTDETAYESILKDIARIKKLGVDKDELIVVVSDDTETMLLLDKRYANTASQLAAEMIREGITGKINGVPVIVSSNLRDDHFVTEYMVFGRSWAQTVEDWKIAPAINDIRNSTHIGASALQGRMVYKDVLLDPTTCVVKRKIANVPKTTATLGLSIDGNVITATTVYTDKADAQDDWFVDVFIDASETIPAGTEIEINSSGDEWVVPTGGTKRVWLSDIVHAASGGTRSPLNEVGGGDHTKEIAIDVSKLAAAWKGTITVNVITSNQPGRATTYESQTGKQLDYWHTIVSEKKYIELVVKG